MRSLRISLLAMAFLCLAVSCSKDEAVVPEEELNFSFDIDVNLANKTDWVMANEILQLLNDHRQGIGLQPLKLDNQYGSAYSVQHTDYMIINGRVSHDNFGTRASGMRERGAKMVGENVAYGYTSAEEVVFAWLNSPGHRETIESDYTHAGFGIVQDARGTYYFTNLFYSK
ncbi:CAP domain-containing protein [Aureitalea marina]|uniref:SCP domain-containing protein n=1 Tax=Aureitalea marina TaxID=930804 RepID=A0A2S7KS07_9FLAO|nr:CAP domain-containing protein [Aureitalea marina]PQB05343.1 hypothetical protein BST85_10940 [Aureitalea marina]